MEMHGECKIKFTLICYTHSDTIYEHISNYNCVHCLDSVLGLKNKKQGIVASCFARSEPTQVLLVGNVKGYYVK